MADDPRTAEPLGEQDSTPTQPAGEQVHSPGNVTSGGHDEVQEVQAAEEVQEDETQVAALDIPEDIPHFSEESLQKLSQGVLDKCLPQLEKTKATLTEITENQRILIETVIQENAKFHESEAMEEVTVTMEKAKVYHAKLLNIKKDMLQLHEKSAKLKKRALKLQQQKQKEILQQEQEREKREDRERQLMAQPAKPTAKSKS